MVSSVSVSDVTRPFTNRIADTFFLFPLRSGPTALDALLFAYLHCLLSGPDEVRLDVVRRTNLVNWERRVRVIVQTAFVHV